MDDEEQVTMIDFPQMVSTAHINAKCARLGLGLGPG